MLIVDYGGLVVVWHVVLRWSINIVAVHRARLVLGWLTVNYAYANNRR